MAPPLLGLPLEFVLFGLTLIGIALFHKRALWVSLAGLTTTVVYKVTFTGFMDGAGLMGLALHLPHAFARRLCNPGPPL
jgi:hypothetical protein